jgi:broad specificity phosphatase PhoE
MLVLLVRHGESEGNKNRSIHKTTPDHAIPLSDLGKKQARNAGKIISSFLRLHLVKGKRCRLWTSPYTRTRETANCIMETAGEYIIDMKEHILLCEQQFGLFDGLSNEELQTIYPREYAFYDKCEKFEGRFWARMPLGESRFDVATRVHQAFGTFRRDRDQHEIENIIVVCHGVTLRAFVMMWCHYTPEWFDKEPNPNNCTVRLIKDGRDEGYI